MNDISIAVPAYEMKGYGGKYLKELFSSIEKQSHKDVEVVVSDHSRDNMDVYKACEEYSDRLRIVYIQNFYDRGNGPANTNFALKRCTGNIIKIMFQDDLFTDERSLIKIYGRFLDTNTSWVVTGFNHTQDGKEFYRPMVPRWSEHLLEGQNFMGGPSIVTMRKEALELFDPECKMLMDTEFYHRMRYNHGMPEIIEDILVSSREGDYRISANLDLDIVCQHPAGSWEANSEELKYVTDKHEHTRNYET